MYEIWKAMRQRCNNPKNKNYHQYGGRGIKVCARWDCFVAFAADMGERPEGMTIERIDGAKGYEPSNCRWATWDEQRKNKTSWKKLGPSEVRQVLLLVSMGYSQPYIASLFGVHQANVSYWKRKAEKHLEKING